MRALIAATAILVSILTDLVGAQSQVADDSNSLLEGNAAYGGPRLIRVATNGDIFIAESLAGAFVY